VSHANSRGHVLPSNDVWYQAVVADQFVHVFDQDIGTSRAHDLGASGVLSKPFVKKVVAADEATEVVPFGEVLPEEHYREITGCLLARSTAAASAGISRGGLSNAVSKRSK
jgi:hypothetical protein